jgi:hypothetical protein
VTLLDCCLAIVEPGYEAPRARASYEETMPRVKPAYDLCKTCGQDERKPGRAECAWCLAQSPAAVVERLRANESARERWRLKSQAAREAAAAEKKAAMTPDESKRYDDEREKRRVGALRAQCKTCACGRALPCSRRMCR